MADLVVRKGTCEWLVRPWSDRRFQISLLSEAPYWERSSNGVSADGFAEIATAGDLLVSLRVTHRSLGCYGRDVAAKRAAEYHRKAVEALGDWLARKSTKRTLRRAGAAHRGRELKEATSALERQKEALSAARKRLVAAKKAVSRGR